MKTLPFALAAACLGTSLASAQTVTQIPLNYNFNGILHAGEETVPDAPNGFRSISDRALDFTGGAPTGSLVAPYQLVTSAGVLDIVHIGNRNTVNGGGQPFDATADGDNIGIQPTWLLDPDQSGPQTTTLPNPVALQGVSSATFLMQVSNGGGSIDITIGFQNGTSTTAQVGAGDWFGGPFAGSEAVDLGVPGSNLSLSEVEVDLSAFDGQSVTSITFENPTNTNAGYAIVAGNINSSQTPVSIVNVPLDYNFNGICHAGEDGNPDDPNGFRSISDRALDFTGGLPTNPISDGFLLQDQAFALDIVHLGNRDTVDNGNYVFDLTADGDNVGIQPSWLANADQSGPQTTTLASPIGIGSNGEAKVLFQISNGGGSFNVTFGLQSGGTVVGTVTGNDWFGGTFLGRGSVDNAFADANLNLVVGTIDLASAAGDAITSVTFSNSTSNFGGVAIVAVNVESTGLGTNYCSATANSTGQTGTISASGSSSIATNDLTLTAENLPPAQFGIFIVSPTQGFVPGTGGTSNGNLCLSGSIGRYSQPGQILSSGGAGTFSLAIDLLAIPQGAGTVPTTSGQTWNFQAWHRDGVGLGSNFTDAISIIFL